MHSKILMLWCLIVCSVAVQSQPFSSEVLGLQQSRHREALGTDSWDHYVLAEETPPGTCYIYEENGSGGSCDYPKNASLWTIHGLWPTLGDSLGPNWCGNSSNITFTPDPITDLISLMAMSWPNIETNTPFYSFWAHEWLKHGTCAGMEMHQYFSKVLSLFNNGFNYGAILDKSGIVPSLTKTYHVGNFTSAFNRHLGVVPLLECHYSKASGQTLHQIQICLDKKFQVTDCPLPKSSEGFCWSSETVHYIPSKYHIMTTS